MIRKSDMIHIGLDKLIWFLELEDERHLQALMVLVGCVNLEDFAEFLSQYATVCEVCHSDYVYLAYEDLLCADCLDSILEKE